MSSPNDFNTGIIEEFRANGGVVGGMFEGKPVLLLHHTGAKTGTERVNPLMYRRDDDDNWVIFGSRGGAPTHAHWFLNLRANPEATIEVGTQTVPVRARIAEGDEHERLWEAQKAEWPQFAEYEANSQGRVIPVIVLERR